MTQHAACRNRTCSGSAVSSGQGGRKPCQRRTRSVAGTSAVGKPVVPKPCFSDVLSDPARVEKVLGGIVGVMSKSTTPSRDSKPGLSGRICSGPRKPWPGQPMIVSGAIHQSPAKLCEKGKGCKMRQGRRGLVNMHVLIVLAIVMVLGVSAVIQAQAQADGPWSNYSDPKRRFSVELPPGMVFQSQDSNENTSVFYGSEAAYALGVEITQVAADMTAQKAAQAVISAYSKPGGPKGFELLGEPFVGQLSGREAVYFIYSFLTEEGDALKSGHGFVVDSGRLFVLRFADERDSFDGNVALFNRILSTFRIIPPGGGGQFGLGTMTAPGEAQGPGQGQGRPGQGPEVRDGVLRDRLGFFTLELVEGLELWEYRRGDQEVDPLFGLFSTWDKRPMHQYLFVWDYIDEVDQKEKQYEIIMGIIENVPGTIKSAMDTIMKRNFPDEPLPTEKRVKIGNMAAIKFTPQTLRTMLKGRDREWYSSVVYMAKSGVFLVFWYVPSTIPEASLKSLMESFLFLR